MIAIRTILLTLGAIALAFGAAAQGRDHGGRHDGGGHGGGGYAAPDRGAYAPRGGEFPGGGALHNGGRFGYSGYDERGYSAGPFNRAPSFAPSQSFRRGQYIPHPYWSGEIVNPKSRHLRTPPPGYGWIGVGPNAYLMQRSTGLVLDSVPGAW